MNILILGSGGREHALAWKIAQSKKINNLWVATGNAGTASCGINVSISSFDEIKEFVIKNKVDMVIPAPEVHLVNGIHDFFLKDNELKNIPVIGPQKAGAQLEGSKDFAKEFMKKHNIPTAAYKTFDKDSLQEGIEFIETLKPPYVLKADGLAAGKGVVICMDIEEAKKELKEMIENSKFGDASRKVVIEEYLDGIELSVFIITDGKTYKILPMAKDYKKIGDGDTGPNTGGMGAISPVPFADSDFMNKVETRIIIPTIDGLKKENIPYCGFIFFGLMNVKGNPYVIEYNVRLGDPEAEAILPRIKSDFTDLLEGVANKTLSEKTIEIDDCYTATVIMASGGYPGKYQNNKEILGLDKVMNSIVFHAGTTFGSSGQKIITNGGRVLAVTSFGNSLKEAVKKSYESIRNINFENNYFRKDIGKDLS